MSKTNNEILIVEAEFPWNYLSDCDEEKLNKMREEFLKSCIKCSSSITLTGIITGVGPGGYEEKNIQIKL